MKTKPEGETNDGRAVPPRRWRTARSAVEGVVKAGAGAYERERDLPALIRADPQALAVDTAAGISAIVSRLERALRAERNRARAGHWTYDLNRHIALHQAHLAERERLAAFGKKRS